MKKIYSTLLLLILAISLKATSYSVTIVGTTYSPATLTVTVGDVVTISASSFHPLSEVSQANWTAGNTATLSTGFGTKTSAYTFTITSSNTIYYMCQNHGPNGMKGQINIVTVGLNEQNNVIGNISLFPNPAKDKFTIKFNSTENVVVTAKLYSICGQEIESLVTNKEFNAGFNSVNFELQGIIPSGIYFVQLNYNSKKIVRKLIIN